MICQLAFFTILCQLAFVKMLWQLTFFTMLYMLAFFVITDFAMILIYTGMLMLQLHKQVGKLPDVLIGLMHTSESTNFATLISHLYPVSHLVRVIWVQ